MNDTIGQPRPGRIAISRIYDVSRALFAVVGVTAVAVAALPAPRQANAGKTIALGMEDSRLSKRADDPIQLRERVASVPAREQRALAEFLAKRFRVAEEAVTRFVTTAYDAGGELRVDPLLILAIIAVESRFNPVAQSAFGAKGLMQVIPKFHMDKVGMLGGEDALLEPETNIHVGTRILREYLRRSGGTEGALQMYAGAFDDASAAYSGKVLAERARLEQMLARLRRAV